MNNRITELLIKTADTTNSSTVAAEVAEVVADSATRGHKDQRMVAAAGVVEWGSGKPVR